MDELLGSPLLRWGVALLALAVLLRVAVRLLFPARPAPGFVKVRCSSCRWTGTVGKYNRKCGRCASTALEDVRG